MLLAAAAVVTTPVSLRVVVTDGHGRPKAAGGLARWVAAVAPAAARGEMVLALVSDRKMRALNRQFRGVDRATDVLSFPTRGTAAGGRRARGPAERLLGDVVIATGVARRQATRARHSYAVELRRLALHGLLHLLGYDHTRDTGQMLRLERRLWRAAGMPGEIA